MNEKPNSGHAPLPQADAVLEMLGMPQAEGSTCALLTPAIKVRLRELSAGQVLEVLVDDPLAEDDIKSWSRLSGHELLAMDTDSAAGILRFYLRKKSS